jgi:hypothetical protein
MSKSKYPRHTDEEENLAHPAALSARIEKTSVRTTTLSGRRR